MIVVVATRCPRSAFRYTLLIREMGFQALVVRETGGLFSCILDPRSGLLIAEDGFVPNTSAHGLINLIRTIQGPKSQIPVIRVWKGLIAAGGHESASTLTIQSPLTGAQLESALVSFRLMDRVNQE